jgi:hypothetical protein
MHPDEEYAFDHDYEEWNPYPSPKEKKMSECLEETDEEIERRLEAIKASQAQSVQERTWKEFQEAGLLWLANRILHLAGWAIVVVQEADGSISQVYPARVKFRGFCENVEARGFQRVSNYLKANIEELTKEANDVD